MTKPTLLKSVSRDVPEYEGIRKGQRVKVRGEVLVEWKLRGMSPEGIAKRACPAIVKRIVISDAHGWNSVQLAHDNGHVGWHAAADLEGATR